jgi:hypothetical protein
MVRLTSRLTAGQPVMMCAKSVVKAESPAAVEDQAPEASVARLDSVV